jgi:hypothetical protein
MCNKSYWICCYVVIDHVGSSDPIEEDNNIFGVGASMEKSSPNLLLESCLCLGGYL